MMRILVVPAILGLLVACLWTPAALGEDLMPTIARWYDNKEAAVSLRFDDNLESHVRTAIPLVNRFGIKATFMVNPGKKSFKDHEQFWVEKVPEMGHLLGNHTMNHRGARNLEEAETEIGDAARFIWRLYPEHSKLTIFASGGGEKWGGNKWSEADESYKAIVKKYHQIDLYDGKNDSFSVNSENKVNDLTKQIEIAVENRLHQPFTFHHIGSPRIRDFITKVIKGRSYSFSKVEFESFLDYLSRDSDRLWIAPQAHILKYEKEYADARLGNFYSNSSRVKVDLFVDSDPELYDQDLTIVFPLGKTLNQIHSITQNGVNINKYSTMDDKIIVNVQPISSVISLEFN